MPSTRETSRLIAQSWSQQPAEVKAAYQSRAEQAHSPPSGNSPGSGQRVPLTNACQNAPGGYAPQVPVYYDRSAGGAHSQYQSPAALWGDLSFDPATWQLDPGPPSGPVNVSLGSYQYDNSAPGAAQDGNIYPFGCQDVSTLATQIIAYKIPYHELQLVASNATASSSAQFSAGHAVHNATSNDQGFATSPGSPSIQQYLSTLSGPQLQAVRAYVQQHIVNTQSQRTHNSRG